MKKLSSLLLILISVSVSGYGQVDTTYIYNTTTPYGTLDIRIAKSSTRYYYLQENKTFSFRESSPGAKTNTYRDMTPWESSPYSQGNLREKNGTSDAFIMNYRLLFPGGYQASYSKGYPMIVMMHGVGESGNCWNANCNWADGSWRPSTNNPPAPTDANHPLLNNDENMSHGGRQHLEARNLAGSKLPDDLAVPDRSFPGFVLFPQNLNGWETTSMQDLIRLIRLAVKKYNIDPNKIYLHGLSNGGMGTYSVIKRAPWLFAAVLPMSAPGDGGIFGANLQASVAHIPIWTFQGGKDIAPSPATTEGYVRRFRAVGAEVRYTLYSHLAHGTWNTAYQEHDFFTWMRSKSKAKLHVFFNNAVICDANGQGVKMGFSAGFLAYQWEKDGQIIASATGHEYVATQPGVYRARFSRVSRTPGSTQWEEWSQPVSVTRANPERANIIPLTTTHLRGPDNAPQNVITLKSETKSDKYQWYKNGVLINIPNNNADDTVSLYTINSTSTASNGAYKLVTSTLGNCPSPESTPISLFFNNSAPLLADANIPGSFALQSVTGSTASLLWQDRSSVETAYEIWRRAPGQSFVFAGRTAANTQSFTDRGLMPSTKYDYKIRAVNHQARSKYAPGDVLTTNLEVTTNADTQAPTPPANLKVVKNTTSSISLSWDASTDNNGAIQHYVVYYGSQSIQTNSSNPTYTLTGLPVNATYQITVKAVDNANLFSPASNQITGTTSVTGLWYGHSTGAWTDLDQITTWPDPEFTGWVPNFTLAPRTQDTFFNFEFTGYLYIETGGEYFFYLNSDDGSRLYIDGVQVIDFDGIHVKSAANGGFGPKSAAVPLSAGPHDIRVIFFEDKEGEFISVGYEGADTDNVRKLIPDAALKSGDPVTGTNKLPLVSISSPVNNQNYPAPATVTINATASDPDGTITKVEFYNGATKLGEDITSPYSFVWNSVPEGSYTLMGKAIDNNNGATNSQTVGISVTGGVACSGAGNIQHEIWTNIPGTAISAIPTDTKTPNYVKVLTKFETPNYWSDNYGSRVRGYLCVPVSGNYIFWLSGDDTGELWLSTDSNPANKRMIASVSSGTGLKEWTKYPSQKSVEITMVADKKYYIEALHKEGTGADHVAVGWQLPDGTLERPIPGNRLIPFGQADNPQPVVSITSPAEGQTFTAPASVSITANASVSGGTIAKVEFYNGTAKLGEDLISPYAFTWNNVAAGNYNITAKAIDNAGAIASKGVNIIVSSGSSSACAGTGTIQREIWSGIPGTSVSSIPVNSAPGKILDLASFQTPNYYGNDYGSRIRGYICAPATGAYTFWISGDDAAELWLSTDTDPANKTRIASFTAGTALLQWNKYPSQQSQTVNLIQGQQYYIEALHKEGGGGDHVAVGWQLPDGVLERPITGNRLLPFSNASEDMSFQQTTAMTSGTSEGENMMESEIDELSAGDSELSIYPNPAESGFIELTIAGNQDLADGTVTTVEIVRMTGEVIYSEKTFCASDCNDNWVGVRKDLAAGVYLVNVVRNGKRLSKRLLVK